MYTVTGFDLSYPRCCSALDLFFLVLWGQGVSPRSRVPGVHLALPLGCLQACILRKCLKAGQPLSADNLPELRIVLHDTLLAAESLTPPFMRALARQGWQTEKIVVEAHRRRARW